MVDAFEAMAETPEIVDARPYFNGSLPRAVVELLARRFAIVIERDPSRFAIVIEHDDLKRAPHSVQVRLTARGALHLARLLAEDEEGGE